MIQKFELNGRVAYNNGRGSALRSRSPGKQSIGEQDINFKNQSPLRSQSPLDFRRQQASITEEELFEERRGEELRRQIRLKELELEQIAQNKDRLRIRINSTLGFGQQLNPQSSMRPVSPLMPTVHQIYSKPIPVEPSVQIQNRSPLRNNSPVERTEIRRNSSQSPLRDNSRAQQQHSINDQISHGKFSIDKISAKKQDVHLQNPPAINSKNTDYISQLHSDNTQLQRRLELVASELDRVTREKGLHFERYQSLVTQTQFYQKSIRAEHDQDQQTEALHENIFVSREENKRIQNHLNESDFARKELITKLRILKNERDRLVQNSEELNVGLQHKVAVMKDIESDMFLCQNKIQDVTNQIQVYERQSKEDRLRVHDIQIVIDRLFREREELNQKMHHLTQSYDHAVTDISRERAQIESHNKRHTQILTSKALFQSLEAMVLVRKQAVINEFFNYCKFDQNCHRVLRQFSGVLFKCGQYQMKIALKTWYRNTYKPTQMQKQNYKLSANLYDSKLKQRAFSRFRDTLNSRGQATDNVQIAVYKLWRFKVKDVQKDVRRSLHVWRDHTHLYSQRVIRIKFLLLRQRTNLRRQALMTWRNYSQQLDSAIRHHILSTEFASDQQKLIIINAMRYGIAEMKELRRRKLSNLMKAWKDSISYRRYMMAQNVQVGHMRRNLNWRLAAACFQAMRMQKEQEKHQLLFANLEGDCQPQMLHLKQNIEDLCESDYRQRKLRSLTCLSNRLLSFLGSYFTQWRRHTSTVDFKIRKNLRQLVVSRYLNQIHRAFDSWFKGLQFSKRVQQQSTIEGLVEEGQALRTKNFSLGKTVQEEKNRQNKNARTGFTRASNIMKRRMLRFGLVRWSDQCKRLDMMEQKAGLIMKKKRKNLCFQALAIYKKKTKAIQQADLDEARMQFQIITISMRRERQIFNAFYRYVQNYSKAKTSLGVLVTKMEIWLQRRTFFRWAEQGNIKTECKLRQNQNLQTNNFDQLNQVYGGLVNQLNDAHSENTEMIAQLKRQGQRILANVFARFYYSTEARGIRKWRQVVKNQRHLEHLVKGAIDHNRRRMFYFAKALIKNYIAKCKISEAKDQIRQTQLETNNTIQLTQFNRTQFEQQQQDRAQRTQIVLQKLERLQQKGSWTVLMITKVNQKNYYQSKLRFIFNCWSNFTKKQIQFCKSIEKVISKSLWQNGFDNINAFSRDKKLTRHQNVAIQDMRKLFWRKNCERAITLLKTKTFNNIVLVKHQTEQATLENIVTHQRTIVKNQDQRVKTGNTQIVTDQRRNLLRAWSNAVIFLRRIRSCQRSHDELMQGYLSKCAIRKWHQRAKHTKKCRGLQSKFKERSRILHLRSLYSKWSQNYYQNKNFATILSNIAGKFDTKAKQNALQMIQNFVDSRKSINQLDKKVASQSVFSVLHQLHLKKMTDYLSELRVRVVNQKLKDLVIGSMFGHWYARDLRRRFLHWRDQARKATTVIEVNEGGPIVEEVLEAQQNWVNLINFMKDQGYTEKEVEMFCERAKSFSEGLIRKTIARMRHVVGDSYLKPKMFDRWRQFVNMRKLLRYILRNLENKLKPVRADLSIAFNRWKFRSNQKNDTLNGVDRVLMLKDIAKKNERLSQLGQLESKANYFMTTMGLQRDELIENYLKSQRLAIAAGRDNLERGVQKGFSAMVDHCHTQKRTNFELLLQRNISLISSLKEKIRDFEFDNQELANENEDLRQFSLDGYQIAKGVQSLSDERERLSVDLADKANTVKGLLDENETLQIKLRQAQESAVTLIHQSNLTMQRMQMSTASLRH